MAEDVKVEDAPIEPNQPRTGGERQVLYMSANDPYTEAHLVAAAIRVLEHQTGAPPSLEAVCETLSFSPERGRLLARKLSDAGIVEITETAYGNRAFIKDHLAIESLPRQQAEETLQSEIERFRRDRQGFARKIETLASKNEQRKKDLFAEIEKGIKKAGA